MRGFLDGFYFGRHSTPDAAVVIRVPPPQAGVTVVVTALEAGLRVAVVVGVAVALADVALTFVAAVVAADAQLIAPG